MASEDFFMQEQVVQTSQFPIAAEGKKSKPAGGKLLMSFTQGNFPIVALLAAGLLCVYLLSLRGGPTTASAKQQDAEKKVDSALTVLRGLGNSDKTAQKAKTIVEAFYFETRQRQVPITYLATNPFAFKVPAETQALPLNTQDSRSKASEDSSGDKASDAVKQLRLQSVLKGPTESVAMVSNNLLTEGQLINGWTVKKIESNRVILERQNQVHVLEMPR